MKKLIIFTLLFATQARADFWCPVDNSIRFPKPSDKECFDVGDDFNPEVAEVVIVKGKKTVVISSAKQQAHDLKKQDELQKQQKALSDKAVCVALYKDIDKAKSVNDLLPIIKCLSE